MCHRLVPLLPLICALPYCLVKRVTSFATRSYSFLVVLFLDTLGSFRLDYEYEIDYEYDFLILVFRLHIREL